ncbi:LacI family DNA-binding transcriptional regulator [Arthrobacter sp. BHU FT2]|nr:LacI family DNA-binding transcriptional regulator [Arthrobacter sp. BHU FT2]
MARPTSTDVARAAGVSQSTVSRSFRGDPKVLAETRKRVLAVADQMGYVPDVFARNMVTRRSNIIAVVIPDMVNPVFTAMVEVLHAELQRQGLRMMLFLERDFESGPHDILGPGGLPADGVILASATVDSPVVQEIVRRKIPAILMQRDAPLVDVDRVMPDDRAGCAIAAQHLAALGHRKIGIITGTPRTSSGKARLDYFAAALARQGLALEDRYIRIGRPDFHGSVEVARDLLSMKEPPTAVFGASDTIAITILNVARELSLRVPEQLSVIGYDDIDAAGWPLIGLTTVQQDIAAQCTRALQMLLDRVEGYDGPARTELSPVRLVLRDSAGHATAPHPQPGNGDVMSSVQATGAAEASAAV